MRYLEYARGARAAGPILALVSLLVGGCTVEPDPEFGHGSPRPPCLYQLDPDRVPYYAAPDVVADGWSDPVMVAAPVTDACPNDATEISRDGTTLFFFWSPTVGGSNEVLLHIHTGTYRAERVGADPGVFGEPTYYDLQKGAGGSVDAAPSFTPAGDWVYFHSTRSANTGYQSTPFVDDPMDIYRARITNGEAGVATNLGEPVNSVHLDGEHGLSPDGLRLYLTSTRPGAVGGDDDADIWLSEWTGSEWSDPVNLGEPINSIGFDGQPAFAADDPDTMYFVSNHDGPSAIYQSTFDPGAGSWGEPGMLISGYVGEPSLVGDGRVLYFVHVLIDDEGVFGSNIWYTVRTE